MAVRSSVLAITGATPQVIADAGKSTDGASGSVLNSGGVTVYLGGDDLTVGTVATKGFPLASGSSMDFDLVYGEAIYACVASGTGGLTVIVNKVT